jgi:hypothetical protein
VGILKIKSNPDVAQSGVACIKSRIQAFVPSLFNHSLVKLYTEGDLTAVGHYGEMVAQNIIKVRQQHERIKRQ